MSKRDYPDSVVTTWALSFQQVERVSPLAAALLRLCVFLHPHAIPIELLEVGAHALEADLEATANDPLALDEAIQHLVTFSFVRRNARTKTLGTHRPVQAVLEDTMDDDSRRGWVERAVRTVSDCFPLTSARLHGGHNASAIGHTHAGAAGLFGPQCGGLGAPVADQPSHTTLWHLAPGA